MTTLVQQMETLRTNRQRNLDKMDNASDELMVFLISEDKRMGLEYSKLVELNNK